MGCSTHEQRTGSAAGRVSRSASTRQAAHDCNNWRQLHSLESKALPTELHGPNCCEMVGKQPACRQNNRDFVIHSNCGPLTVHHGHAVAADDIGQDLQERLVLAQLRGTRSVSGERQRQQVQPPPRSMLAEASLQLHAAPRPAKPTLMRDRPPRRSSPLCTPRSFSASWRRRASVMT